MPTIFISILLLYQLLLTHHPQVLEAKQFPETEEIVNEHSKCSYKDEYISFKCPDDIKILLDIPLTGPWDQRRITFMFWNEKHEQYMPTGLTITFPDNFRSRAYIMWPEEKVKNTPDDFYGLEEYYKNDRESDYKEMYFGERNGFRVDISGMSAHFEIYIEFLKGYSAHTYRIVANYTSEKYEKRIDNILETFIETAEFYQ